MATILNAVVDDFDGIADTSTGNFVAVMSGVGISRNTAGGAIEFDHGFSSVNVAGVVSAAQGAGIIMGQDFASSGGSNSVTVASSGIVFGHSGSGVDLSDGSNKVLNDGFISSDVTGVVLGGDNNRVVNSGTIMGGNSGVGFSAATISSINTLENFGLISGQGNGSGNAVQSFTGADNVLNRGTLSGDVSLFGQNDLVDNLGGVITGTIRFGSGDDELIGGDQREKASGGSGADVMDFGGGRDFFIAGNDEEASSDNGDDLDGGDGIDTYDARQIGSAVFVSLTEQRAFGSAIGTDLVVNFENVFGSLVGDTLTGDALRNILRGGAGNDILTGLNGDDRLFGDAGVDTITGGSGRDVMTGGTGPDVFDFNATSETAATDAGRDIITDFTVGSDDIDLSTIDADAILAGNQAFTFIGAAAFSNVAGQLRFATSASTGVTVVTGDVDGNGTSDFQIALFGNLVLTAADFVL